jgi:murein L,D-transpeptidase YafK
VSDAHADSSSGVALWPEIRLWLDQKSMHADRAERKARFNSGLPQRGTPDLAAFDARLDAAGVALGAPVFLRIFKRESELELWMKRGSRFVLFATYPICRWSGTLGPKHREGDRQAPEGFYTVDKSQLNPNSRWHRSFNLGYPNAFDAGHGRTGSFLMVHGGCTSIGCYAMTDEIVDEIWRLVTAALDGGQARFSVHAFPFRMTDDNLAIHSGASDAAFWRDLKAGYDAFEEYATPPLVSVCDGRYSVTPGELGSDGSAPLAAACSAVAGR